MMTTTDTTTLSDQLRELRLPPTAVECPDWCANWQGPGQPYEVEDDEGFQQRHHFRGFGLPGGAVSVEVGTLATWRGDHEEMEPLSIRVALNVIGGDTVDIAAVTARELATQLVEAAEFMEAQA